GRALEGCDQRRLAIRGNAGRGGERACHGLPDQHQFQDLTLIRLLGELARRWNIRQFRLLLDPGLNQDVDLLVLEPVRVAAFERAPRQPAEPIDLAALGRELDLIGAGIARHDLDLGAEDVAVKQRENVGIGTRALAAKSGGCDEEFAEGLHRSVVPGDARLTSSVTLPSQVNLVLSNSALSSNGAVPWLRENVPMTEPSFGATE